MIASDACSDYPPGSASKASTPCIEHRFHACKLLRNAQAQVHSTQVADFLGFLDERTPHGRLMRRLQKLGLLE